MEPAPEEIAEDVRREIAGESILWAGRPDRWGYARRYWATAAIGIPFMAFAVIWTYGMLHIAVKNNDAMDTFFPLWGLMFVGIGIGMLLSPFFMAWRAKYAYYVVTDRRAVIFEKPWKLRIRSFHPAALTSFERVSDGSTRGSIVFQRVIEQSGRGTRTREIGFIGLKDFAAAEKAIAQLVSNHEKA